MEISQPKSDRLLAGCLITKRERPEDLARALAHHSEDTKVVIQFSEV